jgi:hypothetical protein
MAERATQQRHWLIQGFDGQRKIYERKVGLGQLSEKQVEAILKALAAKAGLDFDEIIGAYATRGTKIANDLLRVQRDGPSPRFSCGENPYFIALIAQADSVHHQRRRTAKPS